jgi:hypothetical protein
MIPASERAKTVHALNSSATVTGMINISTYYVFIILSGVRLSPLGTAATTGLLYQPQVVTVEQLVE